jgi:hypothetical protein
MGARRKELFFLCRNTYAQIIAEQKAKGGNLEDSGLGSSIVSDATA